ncbi:hypothetical protein Dimus_001000 [Dionaea muscipula]
MRKMDFRNSRSSCCTGHGSTPTRATTTTSCTAAVPGSSSNIANPSRYESQKRRDWNSFGYYLCNHQPSLTPSLCNDSHVLEFLRYLDQFGKTKVHIQMCPFFGHPNPPAPCPCPLRQAWGSLDSLVGRLRAAYDENGGDPEVNPFAAGAVRLYLREVRDSQSKARGISYSKKKKINKHHSKPPDHEPQLPAAQWPQQLLQPSSSTAFFPDPRPPSS